MTDIKTRPSFRRPRRSNRLRFLRPGERGNSPRGRDGHLRHPGGRRETQAFRILMTWCFWVRRCPAIPLEGYRETLRVPIGDPGHAVCGKPDQAGYSDHHRRHERLAPCPAPRKRHLGRGATLAGTSTTTGDGGMTPEERGHSEQVGLSVPAVALWDEPRRSAQSRRHRSCRGPRVPSPAAAACFLGQKDRSDRVAEMRTLAQRHRSAQRPVAIPDWTGPDDLEIKILELREITGWKVPIYVKVGAAHAPTFDTTLWR